jgi:hypothetical protein
MACINRSACFVTSAVTLALGLGMNISAGAQTPAEVQAPVFAPSLSRRLPNQWEFTPPRRGTPGNTEGGATRSPQQCVQGKKMLTALVPASGGGETISAYPTFFWYQPETSAKSVEFVLRDSRGQEVYSTQYAIAGKKGIMSLELPAFATMSPLAVDQEYYWQLALICDPFDRSADYLVEGWLQRVEANPLLATHTKMANHQDRVAIYANERLWYETLSELVALRRQRPNDVALADAWAKLLNSAGLDMISEEPLFQGAARTNN